ncbi:MAG: D-alanyl-D-alanine carboxypeptidase family protein [Deltaproteobacteria bacterium]
MKSQHILKRNFSAIILMLFFIQLSPFLLKAKSFEKYHSFHQASILADADNGRILRNYRSQKTIYPASLVKMMVALITLEEINKGNIHLSDSIKVSSWASRIGGRQVYLKQGEVFPLSEMMKAMVITSANDVTVAIAEHIAKDVDTFIRLMNQRAQELGMTDTEFHSVHGLPPGRGQHFDRSTARDLLKLALELLNHPEYLDWASVRLDSFRNGTFQLLNTNHRLMRNYKGMDGMKTGYHRKGGFSLVATAKRNERRFVSIVMGVKSSRLRSKLTRMLLDEGFQKYKQVSLDVQLGMSPLSIEVDKGMESSLRLKTAHPLRVILKENERMKISHHFFLEDRIIAPVEEGQKLGDLEYRLGSVSLGKVPLIAEFGVEKAGFFANFANTLFN